MLPRFCELAVYEERGGILPVEICGYFDRYMSALHDANHAKAEKIALEFLHDIIKEKPSWYRQCDTKKTLPERHRWSDTQKTPSRDEDDVYEDNDW